MCKASRSMLLEVSEALLGLLPWRLRGSTASQLLLLPLVGAVGRLSASARTLEGSVGPFSRQAVTA